MRRLLLALPLALLAACGGGGETSSSSAGDGRGFTEVAAQACTTGAGAMPEAGFPADTAAMAEPLRDQGAAIEARADAVADLEPSAPEGERVDELEAAWRAAAGHLDAAATAAEGRDRAGALDALTAFREQAAEADAIADALGLADCAIAPA